MKIVIAGGRDQADFLIGSLLDKKHKLIVVNDDSGYCEYLASTHQIPIVNGDPCKQYILEDAQVHGCDVLIALTSNDADNLAICQSAKRVFAVKKVVCTVSNPKNVDIFKKLGVNTVISATYMVSQYIEQATTIESLIKTLSIEDEKVLISEVLVGGNYPCVNKKVAQIPFPSHTIIGCIIRNTDMIVPKGQTVIEAGDKLLVITSRNNQQKAISAITG